jgi:hypothetical protein
VFLGAEQVEFELPADRSTESHGLRREHIRTTAAAD